MKLKYSYFFYSDLLPMNLLINKQASVRFYRFWFFTAENQRYTNNQAKESYRKKKEKKRREISCVCTLYASTAIWISSPTHWLITNGRHAAGLGYWEGENEDRNRKIIKIKATQSKQRAEGPDKVKRKTKMKIENLWKCERRKDIKADEKLVRES